MKFKNLLILFIVNISFIQGQNFTVSNSQQPKCFGECNGNITFTSGIVSGPFTATVANSSACPNSTVQNSTNNSITINSICACSGVYTVTIYTGSVIAGTEIFQFPNYATSSLVVFVNNISASSCSNCCDAGANITYTGGNVQGTPTFSMDGIATTSVTPAPGLCPGSHTICVKDASKCVACKTFNTPFLAGIFENTLNFPISISPNPANSAILIESSLNNFISKVEIFDLTGRKISESTAASKAEIKVKLELSTLTDGLYYLYVYNSEGQLMQHLKFVKVSG